jgi:hypothetical protein
MNETNAEMTRHEELINESNECAASTWIAGRILFYYSTA